MPLLVRAKRGAAVAAAQADAQIHARAAMEAQMKEDVGAQARELVVSD